MWHFICHVKCHVTCDMSCGMWHMTVHMSHITCYIPHGTFHLTFHVTCHVNCQTWISYHVTNYVTHGHHIMSLSTPNNAKMKSHSEVWHRAYLFLARISIVVVASRRRHHRHRRLYNCHHRRHYRRNRCLYSMESASTRVTYSVHVQVYKRKDATNSAQQCPTMPNNAQQCPTKSIPIRVCRVSSYIMRNEEQWMQLYYVATNSNSIQWIRQPNITNRIFSSNYYPSNIPQLRAIYVWLKLKIYRRTNSQCTYIYSSTWLFIGKIKPFSGHWMPWLGRIRLKLVFRSVCIYIYDHSDWLGNKRVRFDKHQNHKRTDPVLWKRVWNASGFHSMRALYPLQSHPVWNDPYSPELCRLLINI